MNEKTNKVENGAVARLIRTIGFFLVLIISFILGVHALEAIGVPFITNLVKPINDIVNSNDLELLIEYRYIILLAGLLMLVWTQSRSYFARIFITVVTLLMTFVVNSVPGVFNIDYVNVNNLVPFLPEVSSLNDILIDFFNITEWLVLIILVPILLLFILFGYKKPKRISTTFLSNGLVLLLLTVLVMYLPVLLDQNWAEANWFGYVVNSMLSLSFIVISLGSTFGVLGIFRK